MNIDELIAHLGNMTTDQTTANWIAGIGDAMVAIKEHQPALEKGMKGTLRFQKCHDNFSAVRPEFYSLLDTINLPISKTLGGDYLVQSFDDTQQCIEFADSLGFTAEFVGDGE